jgi:hypothetical protein
MGSVPTEETTMNIDGIHYEFLESVQNPDDGYYYQAVRQVDGDKNLVGVGPATLVAEENRKLAGTAHTWRRSRIHGSRGRLSIRCARFFSWWYAARLRAAMTMTISPMGGGSLVVPAAIL